MGKEERNLNTANRISKLGFSYNIQKKNERKNKTFKYSYFLFDIENKKIERLLRLFFKFLKNREYLIKCLIDFIANLGSRQHYFTRNEYQ